MSIKNICIERINSVAQYLKDKYEITSLFLFGSVAREQDEDASDVDILVDMPPKSLKIVELRYDLEILLGRKVDVVRNRASLDPFFLNEIRQYGIPII